MSCRWMVLCSVVLAGRRGWLLNVIGWMVWRSTNEHSSMDVALQNDGWGYWICAFWREGEDG